MEEQIITVSTIRQTDTIMVLQYESEVKYV